MTKGKLLTGRPENASERLPKEQRCYELLDRLGIEYDRVDHEHADTIEACHEIEKVLCASICKNLFLTNRQQTDFYLLLMPGDKPFKTKLLSKQLGTARLSFASPQHMEELLGVTPGSVSILCLMNDTGGKVKAVIDSDVLKDEFLGCHPCMNTSSLKIRTTDITDKFLPAVHHGFTAVELPWSVEE